MSLLERDRKMASLKILIYLFPPSSCSASLPLFHVPLHVAFDMDHLMKKEWTRPKILKLSTDKILDTISLTIYYSYVVQGCEAKPQGICERNSMYNKC